ncbi:MAG: hypothetical protein IJ367_00840, partial [Clostridia bacterium]|nr:hypothetical protein [Clostridia bacterium]
LTLPPAELQKILPTAEQLIADKRFLPMLDVLLKNTSHSSADILIQLFFVMQDPAYIVKTLSEMFRNQTMEQTDGILVLLNNATFQEKAGEFSSAYLLTLYYYAQDDYESAEQKMPAAELCPPEYTDIFHKIREGIKNRIPLAEIHLKHNQNVPKLSFVEAIPLDPDECYSDLFISFESENRTNNEKTLIRMAKKIYYQMNMDNDFTDYPRLVMRWGFLEIEASQNYTHRLALLQELAENKQLMEDKDSYEKDFLDVFEDIFLSCSERAILQNFEKIQAAGQQIAQLYPNHSIATVLNLLQPVWEDFEHPSKEFKAELSRLLNEATLLRNHHANNRLLQKCYDVIFDYKTVLDNKENLKIEVLNEDGLTFGSVFYTIQNIGFQPVNDLRVVVSVLKGEETLTSPAKTYSQLHRKQTIAEEIEITKEREFEKGIINEDFFSLVSPGEKLQVEMDISYLCQDNEPRNIQVVHTLTVQQPTYEYIKKTCPDFPIHRMELDNIYTTVQNRNLVLLYGTNGTGKTSLLKMLRDKLTLEDNDNSHTFTVLLAKNEAERPTKEIIKEIMTSFCYYDGADADTTSVYTQLNTFLKYSDVPEEKQQRILSEYRKYVSCDATAGPFTFGNFITQLKNLDNKFIEFKNYMNLNFKFYLLWDAFETVISSKDVSPEKMNFKSLIDTFKGEESQIRIVFTGSNKLLEVAEVKDDADLWNIMFRDIDSIKVGNLHYNDFKTIIT